MPTRKLAHIVASQGGWLPHMDALLINTNGHELSVLRSYFDPSPPQHEGPLGTAMSSTARLLNHQRQPHHPALIVLQMYKPGDNYVVQDKTYDPVRTFRFLQSKGYEMRW